MAENDTGEGVEVGDVSADVLGIGPFRVAGGEDVVGVRDLEDRVVEVGHVRPCRDVEIDDGTWHRLMGRLAPSVQVRVPV